MSAARPDVSKLSQLEPIASPVVGVGESVGLGVGARSLVASPEPSPELEPELETGEVIGGRKHRIKKRGAKHGAGVHYHVSFRLLLYSRGRAD